MLLLCITTLNFFSPISRELLLALISLQGESSTFCPSSFPIAKVFNASISPYVWYRLQIWRHFQFFEVIFIDCKLQWPWIKVFWSQVWRVTGSYNGNNLGCRELLGQKWWGLDARISFIYMSFCMCDILYNQTKMVPISNK